MRRFALVVAALIVALYGALQLGLIRAPDGLVTQLPFLGGKKTADAGSAEGKGRRGGGDGKGGDGPSAVLAAAARYADVPVTVDAVGTVAALNTVTVRTQVDGRLVQLAFRDGQDVKQGDPLARIDPSLYQALYDQTLAKKASDEAQLANARIDLARYQRLAVGAMGSQQQADTQKALVAQLEAQLRGDQASIDNVKTTLDFTTIRAPLDGRTGIRLVDQGNILHAGDATGIVTITQVKPIAVVLNLPQQNLRAVTNAQRRGAVTVQALEADNATVIDKGVVEVVDNAVDQTTGTVKIKATYANADLQLWPGQFVNVRLFVDMLPHAVVVPTAAVQRGPNGAFVYVVRDDATVSLRLVSVGQQTETDAVISKGLEPPARVVTTGFARLVDGAAVSVDAQAAAAPAAAPPDAKTSSDAAAREERRRKRKAGAPDAAKTQ